MTQHLVFILMLSVLPMIAHAEKTSFAGCASPTIHKMLGGECAPVEIEDDQSVKNIGRDQDKIRFTNPAYDPIAARISKTPAGEAWRVTVPANALCQGSSPAGVTKVEIKRDDKGRIASIRTVYTATPKSRAAPPVDPVESTASFSYAGGHCEIERLTDTIPQAPEATMVNFDRALCQQVMGVVKSRPVDQLQEGERRRIIKYVDTRSTELTSIVPTDDAPTYLLPYREEKNIAKLVQTCKENSVSATTAQGSSSRRESAAGQSGD